MRKLRLDRYLKLARVIRRRTVAREFCDQGRVKVNEHLAKASHQVAPGDVLTVDFGYKTTRFKVLELPVPGAARETPPYETLSEWKPT